MYSNLNSQFTADTSLASESRNGDSTYTQLPVEWRGGPLLSRALAGAGSRYLEDEAPDRSAALRVWPSTNNKCGGLRRALMREKVRKAEEYRCRRFLTYSAYLLIMAAGCRIRHHYELSHNLFDCWTSGCQTTHLDLPPQLQLSTIRKPCLSRNLNQVRVEVCFLVTSSR